MTKEQMTARLTKVQLDRQTLAVNIDQAVVRLHHMDGQIQLLTELLAESEKESDNEYSPPQSSPRSLS